MIAGLNNKRQGGAGGVFLGHFMTMKPALILSSMLLMLVSSSALLLAAESENVGVSSFNNKGFEQDADSTTNTYAAGKRVLVSDTVSSRMVIYYNSSNASFSHPHFPCHSVALVPDTDDMTYFCNCCSLFDDLLNTSMEKKKEKPKTLSSSSVVPSLMQMFGKRAVVTLLPWLRQLMEVIIAERH
jgi:hypothetical protein